MNGFEVTVFQGADILLAADVTSARASLSDMCGGAPVPFLFDATRVIFDQPGAQLFLANTPMKSVTGSPAVPSCLLLTGEAQTFIALGFWPKDAKCRSRVTVTDWQAWYDNDVVTLIVWDKQAGTLSARRDRAGKFMLVYSQVGQRVAISTSLPLLRRFLGTTDHSLSINRTALIQYFTLGYSVRPATLWKEIQALPSGWEWWVNLYTGETVVRDVWQPSEAIRPQQLSMAEAAQRLRAYTEQAVQERLLDQSPTGCFMSGGLDSTTVTVLAKRFNRSPIHSYSVGYEVGERSFKYNVDLDIARSLAAELGTQHHEVIVHQDTQLLETMRHLIQVCGEPVPVSSVISTYYLLEQASGDGISLLLCGDGFDESFGGTESYRAERLVNLLRAVFPQSLRRLLCQTSLRPIAQRSLLSTYWQRYLSWDGVFEPAEVQRLLDCSVEEIQVALTPLAVHLDNIASHRHIVDAMMDWRIRQAEGTLYPYRYTAHYSSLPVRVRAPLLDRQVLELGYSLPVHLRANILGQRKLLVRRAFADLLPEIVQHRAKWGFFPPYVHWLHLDFVRTYVYEVLPQVAPFVGLDLAAARRVLDAFYLQRTSNQEQLWNLFNLVAWGEVNG